MKPEIAIIVAKAADNGIGCSDGLPWYMPEELKYFKTRTIGKPVIMGRKTFLSLGDGDVGKPLKNRANIVLTRNDFNQEGIYVENSLEAGIDLAIKIAQEEEQNEIMIIGGEDIFKQAINFADVIYLTQIKHEDFEDTNAYLPKNYLDGWEAIEQKTEILYDKKSQLDIECDFKVLRKSA